MNDARHDSAEPRHARVTAAYGRRFRVRFADGFAAPARPARRDVQPVCGDNVRCELDTHHHELRIVAIEPRSTQLARSDSRGGSELLAANATLLIAVLAPEPAPDFYVIDRYLAGAACTGMHAAVVLNKQDLPDPDPSIALELEAWRRIGYPCVQASCRSQHGIDSLRDLLRGQTALLVGQSGVGKSSLLQALIPDSDARVGELDGDAEGRHTTTVARLYELPGGGELIDSPGVRDFAPAIADLEPTTLGFLDVAQLAPRCRFPDCQHMAEPDCAVRAAVDDGSLHARRYESYRRLRRLYERLRPVPGRADERRGRRRPPSR